eukprot:COSAG05_NODE_23990_length_254_cov_0.993548_2_plen_23_part_01
MTQACTQVVDEENRGAANEVIEL